MIFLNETRIEKMNLKKMCKKQYQTIAMRLVDFLVFHSL